MSRSSLFFIFLLFVACKGNKYELNNHLNNFTEQPLLFETINAIPLPRGYERIAPGKNSFGEWLRAIRLKKDNYVYLYNGSLKKNQSAQFAVLDIAVGKKDLQQCADAVMRLRAEYLFDLKRYTEIVFKDNNGKPYAWKGGDDKTRFADYLENVFACCGTASLEKQLKPVMDMQAIQPGDVFVKGGFPGHAMIVVDVAVSKDGRKIFMLAQSYMPAQDIHIVKNPGNEILSPWYEAGEEAMIITPEWKFKQNQLYKW
jgi:hypothetical protein